MMLRTLLATCVLTTAFAIESTTNGATVSFDTSVIQSAEQTYWNMIQGRINAIKVPDLIMKNDTSMYAKDNDFTLTQPTQKFTFKNDVANNCFEISLRQLTGKFTTGNFHAHYKVFGAHGTAHMALDTVHLTFGLRPITQTLPDGR